MAAANGSMSSALIDPAAIANKPKRVRTGCPTCRERHLKCDEALPVCMNCQKSSRVCKRGVRLNFIDTTCQPPPVIAEPDEWHVDFIDESRDIASEYRGGLNRYALVDSSVMMTSMDNPGGFTYGQPIPAPPSARHMSLPSIQGMLPMGQVDEAPQSMNFFDQKDMTQQQTAEAYASASMMAQQAQYEASLQQQHQQMNPPEQQSEAREIINSQEETLFMQVFVEEVGIWMDSMDSMKHFSRILPFHALGQPMLLNAFLACGVRHLTLVNTAVYQEEKALNYYDKASRYLLRALENPERDSVICATTAIILNVYEIMSEKALPRMNHIAGARALIKECGWSARSIGIGAACFWLNVGMELLSNLHFNWQASWHPDTWGVDMNLSQEIETGKEEVWTHRIVYITAKISDFRATLPQSQNSNVNEHIRREKRLQEWAHLKELADTWNNNSPRTMHPLAYLYPYQTSSRSAFPEIWLVKRTTIVARLFYHTAMCVLAQIHPMMGREVREMFDLEQSHAHQICGIVAHVKDRGVASVALRSLAIAAECLSARREQDEILQILTKIHRETGWRIGSIAEKLRETWGWGPDESPQLPTHANPHAHLYTNGGSNASAAGTPVQRSSQYLQQQQQQYADMQQSSPPMPIHPAAASQQQLHTPPVAAAAAPRKIPPQGIVNPMFASADFAMPKHPYQEYWVPPAHGGQMAGAGQLPGLLGLGNGGLYQGLPPPVGYY